MSIYRNQYYHGLTRKYISIFGQLFDKMEVLRYGVDGKEVEREIVPIAYGPKEKWHQTYNQDPEFNKQIAIKLPRMSWELIAMTSDPFRNQNNNLQHATSYSPDGIQPAKFQYFSTPIAYDLTFQLNIITKSVDDIHQLVEQIIPAFKPEIILRTTIIESMGYEMDIPINLSAIQFSDNYNRGNITDRRLIEATLTFTLKAWYVGPVRQAKEIKKIVVDFKDYLNRNRIESVGVAPYASNRDDILSVLSTDDHEFLQISGYYETTDQAFSALDAAYEAKKLLG